MTAMRFENVTGHAAEIKKSHGSWVAKCACSCGRHAVPIYGSVKQTESDALESLVKAVLYEHRQIVLDRAGWKCQQCFAVDGLDVHHRNFRSHGNDHRVANLIALCQKHHDEAHGVRRADRGGVENGQTHTG